jgi:hypothetical protein
MSRSSYPRLNMAPSAQPMAWSDEDASGGDMATTHLSRDDMATEYVPNHWEHNQFDGAWSDDPDLQDFGKFDNSPGRPWYRNPLLYVVPATLAIVIGAVVFVMMTSGNSSDNNAPAGSSVQSTSSSPPSSSTAPPPPPTSAASTNTEPTTPAPSSTESAPPANTNSGSRPSSAGGGNPPKGDGSTTPGTGTPATGGVSKAPATSPSTVVNQPTTSAATNGGSNPIQITIPSIPPIQPGSHVLIKCLLKLQPCP